jgi:hypothetical protein
MADHTDNGIRSAIKALREVIAPAVDPADPLATEQVRLVADFLELLGERLDLLVDRQRYEIAYYAALGDALAADAERCAPAKAAELAAAVDDGRALLARPDARAPELKSAGARAATAVAEVVRAAPGGDADVARRIRRTVVERSRPWLDMQRAWFLPQGFEPDPTALPPLALALDPTSIPDRPSPT